MKKKKFQQVDREGEGKWGTDGCPVRLIYTLFFGEEMGKVFVLWVTTFFLFFLFLFCFCEVVGSPSGYGLAPAFCCLNEKLSCVTMFSCVRVHW